MQYDVFISHSSRDKDEVARPLAQALEDRGLQVWLDEEQLQVGDSIRRGIDAALRESRFGLVVLSPAYLNSEWGQKELDAFFAKEKYNTKSILPIYHGINIEDVEQHWPMLADKISLNTTENIEQLADKIQQSVQSRPSKPARLTALKSKPWWPSNNWQWLIGIILALAAIIIPIWHSTSSPSNSGTVSIQGDVSGGTVIGNQTNHLNINSEAAQLIARSLLQNSKQTSGELQEKEAEIKRLTKTIARLQQQPNDELKQSALKKLEEKKPEEAAQLLRQSLIKQGKALQLQPKQMSKDWVDVGNITYLNNSQEALDAYSKAAALDSGNIEAWNSLGHINHRLGKLDDSIRAYETALKLAGDDQPPQAVTYENLGGTYLTRGEQDKMEEFHLEGLKINKSLGRQESIANQYDKPSMLYLIRDELNEREIDSIEIEYYCVFGHIELPGKIFAVPPSEVDRQVLDQVMRHIVVIPGFEMLAYDLSFEMLAYDLPYAAAVIGNGRRYILYNQELMRNIRDTTGNNWGEIGILAHEIGHHLSAHILDRRDIRPAMELEADKFSGFILQKMGATLSQSVAAMTKIAISTDSQTRLGLGERIEAITSGWTEAESRTVLSSSQSHQHNGRIHSHPMLPIEVNNHIHNGIATSIPRAGVVQTDIASPVSNSSQRLSTHNHIVGGHYVRVHTHYSSDKNHKHN